jgi:hypothetical protein
MAQVRVARLVDGVVVDVDDVVEHPHRDADGALQLVEIQAAVGQVRDQVH